MPLPRLARIALSIFVCAVALAVTGPVEARAMTTPEARLLHRVNHVRAAHGLRRVQVGSTIQSAAHSWAVYLRQHSAFYHGRLSLGTSENIGWLTCRRDWAHDLVRMWLNSPTHRVHLLDPGARRIGVGVSRGRWSGYSCVRIGVTRFR